MIAINMEYPEHCTKCRFDMPDGSCCAMPMNFCGHTTYSELEKRPVWCPLIPIFESHYENGNLVRLVPYPEVFKIGEWTNEYTVSKSG